MLKLMSMLSWPTVMSSAQGRRLRWSQRRLVSHGPASCPTSARERTTWWVVVGSITVKISFVENEVPNHVHHRLGKEAATSVTTCARNTVTALLPAVNCLCPKCMWSYLTAPHAAAVSTQVLFGTCACWFLLDVAYYCNNLYTPEIVKVRLKAFYEQQQEEKIFRSHC